MTTESFLHTADLLPEPMLLVSAGGIVLAVNRAADDRLGLSSSAVRGRPLSELVTEPPDVVARYLRHCCKTRQMVLGSLTIAAGEPLPCRAEGAVFRPTSDGAEALTLLRLVPKQSAAGQFVALNLRIEELGHEIRSRRAAEAALAEEREQLRITLASIGDAVIATDPEGRISFMNSVAEALTRWSRPEATGRPLPEVFNIVNEHTRRPAENPALRALREGTIVGLANHTLLIARDGTERLIDDSAAPVRADAGPVAGAVLVFRDVTERRRADEARARLAAIVESSDDAIVGKNLDGIIQSWNAGAERLFGYTAEEAIGRRITLIIPPERHAEEEMILDRLRRGERVDHFQTVRMAKGGRLLDISLTVSPIRDNEGHVTGASKIARDVTAQKRAEERLARALEREKAQSRLLQQVADAALTIHSAGSLDSVLRVITEEARQILGAHLAISSLTDGEDCSQTVSTQSASEQYEPRLKHRIPPALEGVCADVCRTNQSLRLTRAELEAHPGWNVADEEGKGDAPRQCWTAAPLVSRGGKNLGLIQVIDKDDGGFSEDDEAALVQLAHIAAVAIENARLYEELREQDRRKDEFLALLAHELRNPLAPLRNGLQVMQLAGRDAAATATAREMMNRQLTHMVRLVDDLLDASRISRNKMELRRSRVLLADAVSSAVETVRPAIDAAGLELTVMLPPEPVYLDADLIRLAQVFSNLLSNSAKYTEPGGRIWLSATREGDRVIVSVRDSGIGIPADALPTIFDMFSQVDRSIERTSGGLGIGLALVRGLVEMHGGTVEAASAGLGKGSTFTVRLPALPNESEAVGEGPACEVARGAATQRRILVVDDSRDSATSMAMMLQLIGYEVRTANDGAEALRAVEQFRPDIVLMDVGMPRLNGYDATRRIREQPWGKGIVIIAITGWGQEADRAKSREAGCDGHLVKPVNLPDLEQLLAELMRARGLP